MRFLVGLPTTDGKFDSMVIKSILNQLDFITREHHAMQSCIIKSTMIHNARNSIATESKNYDYLFFIDSDCVLPDGTLERLVRHDKDIVAGMYFHKEPPFWPVIYTRNEKGLFDVIQDYPEKKLIETDGIGMGVCLIKTSVFKKLPEKPFDPYQKDKDSEFINGEDLAFCIRAKESGYKIWVDTGIQAQHQTTRYIDEDYHRAALLKMKQLEKERLSESTR